MTIGRFAARFFFAQLTHMCFHLQGISGHFQYTTIHSISTLKAVKFRISAYLVLTLFLFIFMSALKRHNKTCKFLPSIYIEIELFGAHIFITRICLNLGKWSPRTIAALWRA